jgi:23S rRNA pseudouridine1911/1915/1917 synthase
MKTMAERFVRLIPADADGERLDRHLARVLTDLSRSRIQGLIRAGRVTVDGRPARASLRVAAGQEVSVEVPDPEPFYLEPEALPIAIVFEDDDLVVVDKPAGLVVHPGAGVPRGTLLNALLHHAPSLAGVGGVQRPGLVHRLDRDTSGLLVAAKTDRAYLSLRRQISERTARRIYRAVVWGRPPRDEGEIVAAIGRDPRHRQRMAVREGGKPATTRYRVARAFDLASFLELFLVTGRTHQIRVHMSSLGCPVLGDPTYGGRTRALERIPPAHRRRARGLLESMPRQALHAAVLEFDHPVTGVHAVFQSPLPADMQGLLAALERDAGPRGR